MKKRLLLLLLFVPISMFLAAQTDNPHLTFKGIPIDGELNLFISKLKNEGFIANKFDNGTNVLSGEFASYKDCTVIPVASSSSGLMYSVSVSLPFVSSWSILSTNYYSLKSMLTKKYGDYSDCTEVFQSDIKDINDSYKMMLVNSDRCKYTTTFSNSKGSIVLSIIKGGDMKAAVILLYIDKINSKLESDKAMDDL